MYMYIYTKNYRYLIVIYIDIKPCDVCTALYIKHYEKPSDEMQVCIVGYTRRDFGTIWSEISCSMVCRCEHNQHLLSVMISWNCL